MPPTPHTAPPDMPHTKTLAVAVSARQDGLTTRQDVNREDRNGRLRRRRKLSPSFTKSVAKTAKADDNAQRAYISGRYKEFAIALRVAMNRAGLRASDVARIVWGSTTNKRGYSVAKNRDRIGSYQNGDSFPEPENLEKLAKALGIPVEELASTKPPPKTPAKDETAPERQPRSSIKSTSNLSELVLTRLPAKPGRSRLQVDCELNWKLATHIHNLIRQAEEAERGAMADTMPEGLEIHPRTGTVVGGTDTKKNGTN